MKSLMKMFAALGAWFVSLFKRKGFTEVTEIKKETLAEKYEKAKEEDPKRDWSGFGRRRFSGPPPHNNRKRTRGRHIQYVGNKVIYHDAK